MPTGPSTETSPYLEGAEPNVEFTSILTVGDEVEGSTVQGRPYRMVGIPDGLGLYDLGDGRSVILMNHELGASAGLVRDHGSVGAFVSMLTIENDTLRVISATDLAKDIFLYQPTNPASTANGYFETTTAFARLCSGDLADASAYFFDPTGTNALGTAERIYMAGEETGAEGRQFAFVVTGAEAGDVYELPALGKFSWENALANPVASAKTVVVNTDDSTPGQVTIFVGEKQATGNAIERAGLAEGALYGIKVDGLRLEDASTPAFAAEAGQPGGSRTFSLVALGADADGAGPGTVNDGDVRNMTGAQQEAQSDALGITEFFRPEDGHWDPANPNFFYFVTTANIDSNSRLYRLEFNDSTNPESGGVIRMMLDGTEGHKMADNMTVNDEGMVIFQEDPGGNNRLAKVWQYDPTTDSLTDLAQHDPARFTPGQPGFLTNNEEASGVIDVTTELGTPGVKAYLMDVQAHFAIADPELVEGGQLVLMTVSDPTSGGRGDDEVNGSAAADTLSGGGGLDDIEGGSSDDVLSGNGGGDRIDGGRGDDNLKGGFGDDDLLGGAGADKLLGSAGDDSLTGGADKDVLKGGAGADVFIYTALTDSGVGNALRDVILDFSGSAGEGDTIDLSALDLTFVSDFSGAGDEVRIVSRPNNRYVIEVDGDDADALADFQIIVNTDGQLTSGDLVL